MRRHRDLIWGVLALAVAFTLLVAALARRGGSDVAAASVTVHDRGTATAVEPGTPQYREMGALAGRLVGAARTEVAALAMPWEAAERCKQEGVALEVVFAAPGVQAGVHGTYAMALIPLDQAHEPGRVLVYLGAERYTLLVPADADDELARLRELTKVAAPLGQWWPAPPTVAPVLPGSSPATPAPTFTPTPSPMPSPTTGAAVRGRVVEGYGARRPVAGLPLWLGSESKGHPMAYTGPDGEFVLPNVPPGTHEVVNSHLFFEVTVPEGADQVDAGTLKYPLIHPPPYYYRTPVPLACLEELLTRGGALEYTVCAEDGDWRRAGEAEQRETVWTRRPFSDLDEATLRWWLERPALLYEATDRSMQSFPDGPSLDEPGADHRYLLGAWNSTGLAGLAYEGDVLDDLVARRQLEVWLLGYRAVQVRRLGEHYAVEVRPEEGLQVIRFAGEEDVVAVHVICEGDELVCLPEHPPATLVGVPMAQSTPPVSPDEVAALPAPAVSLAADPRAGAVVYALLANNVLYRSGDGGHTWRRLPLPATEVPYAPPPKAEPVNHVPLLPQQAIVVARGRPERLFVAPVQAVEGVTPLYRSDDGGAIWETVRDDVGAWTVGGESGDILYAWKPPREGREGGIYRSDDAGVTWRQAYAGSFPPAVSGGDDPCGLEGITALAAEREDADLVYAGTDQGLWRSADGGRTWAPFMEGVPSSVRAYRRVALLAQDAAGTVYAVVELWPDASEGCAQLLRLRPGAGEWEAVGPGGLAQLWEREASYGEEFSGLHALVADPVVPGRLYLGTPTRLMVSDDGGESWAPAALPSSLTVYRVALGAGPAGGSGTRAPLYLWTGGGFVVAAAP